MYSDDLLSSRIFSTECGVRPAEPCSVSVVATHQLLTNIFEHIAITIISDCQFSHVSGAQITQQDLQTLERCNRDNIKALEEIVGVDSKGDEIHERRMATEQELRKAGDLWADHILENTKAYIMTFVYIIVTVTIGYGLISGIAAAAGLQSDWAFYITRFFDAFIYFWLPQINVTILRLIQGRNLRHRMVGEFRDGIETLLLVSIHQHRLHCLLFCRTYCRCWRLPLGCSSRRGFLEQNLWCVLLQCYAVFVQNSTL